MVYMFCRSPVPLWSTHTLGEIRWIWTVPVHVGDLNGAGPSNYQRLVTRETLSRSDSNPVWKVVSAVSLPCLNWFSRIPNVHDPGYYEYEVWNRYHVPEVRWSTEKLETYFFGSQSLGFSRSNWCVELWWLIGSITRTSTCVKGGPITFKSHTHITLGNLLFINLVFIVRCSSPSRT